jgi:hypothetical protein
MSYEGRIGSCYGFLKASERFEKGTLRFEVWRKRER